MAKISIVTATLNRPSLKEACESVNRQTYGDWHHYVIGDGVAPFDYAHPRRTTIGFTRAVGAEEPGANMPDGTPNPILRWALRHLALGEFVCFLDDDNVWRPEFLQVMVAALEAEPGAGIAICAVEDLRYHQDIDGYPAYGHCDNSGFLARARQARAVGFPKASPYRRVIQDCEFMEEFSRRYGWVRVPEKLVVFGAHPDLPALRGNVKLLHTWELPYRATRLTRAGAYDEAIEKLLAACEIDSRDAWALWHLGEAFFFSGRREEGLRAWSRWSGLARQSESLWHDSTFYGLALVSMLKGDAAEAHAQLSLARAKAAERMAAEPDNPDHALSRCLYTLVAGDAVAALGAYAETLCQQPPATSVEDAAWRLRLLQRLEIGVSGVTEALETLAAYQPSQGSGPASATSPPPPLAVTT